MISDGGGHPEVEESLTLDAPLKETLAKIESSLAQGFGDMTLGDMVATASARANGLTRPWPSIPPSISTRSNCSR
jgi:hypothetical protein